jgi:dUTP pyrophosphatase
MLPVQKLSEKAIIPTRGSEFAAGYDLYAIESQIIYNNSQAIIKIGIATAIPVGYYGRIAPRSSMALKNIFVNGGVIDSDYRGEIKVILFNFGIDYEINAGDRVAQLIIEKIITPEIKIRELTDTPRGDGGFGSTGN